MEASPGPLVIRRTFRYAPPPWRVFDALADEAHQWWCHRVAPRATVSFKPFEGGRFVQTAGGHQVDYAHVVLIERPRILRLEGAFGMRSQTLNVVTLSLEPEHEGTLLVLDHECRSAVPPDPTRIRHAWGELFGEYLREWMDTEASPIEHPVKPRYPLAG